MLTLIFGIRASEPPRAWRTTEKAGPDRVKSETLDLLSTLWKLRFLRSPSEHQKFSDLNQCLNFDCSQQTFSETI